MPESAVMRHLHPVIPAVVLALAVPCVTLAQASGSYTLSGEIVSIYNLVGLVTIQAGSGSSVEVEVDAQGRDAAELLVETGPIRSAQTLRVIYPDDRIAYRAADFRGNTEMRVSDDGTFFDRDSGRRGRRVRISSRGDGLQAHANLAIAVPAGQTINVYLGLGDVRVSNVNGDLRVDVAAARVESNGTRGRLVIDTGSGSVEVEDAAGEVNVDTGSGSVSVRNVTGERLLVDTGSGSVSGSDIRVRDLSIDTGSGGITLQSVSTTTAVLDTGSGSVRLDLLQDVDQLAIDTGSGSVTVSHPENFGGELNLETRSGGIDFDAPVTVQRISRRSLVGTMGDGNGRIHVDTGSGSIRFILRP